jgi:predicted dehydrogenase
VADRFLTLGAGFWARFQLAGWLSIPEGPRPVAICDPDGDRAARLAAEFGIPHSGTDAETAIRETSPDFVDVISSPDAHAEGVRLALRHNLPVICQKPLAPTFAEARELVQEADAKGVPLAVHENWRYQAAIRKVGRLFHSGVVGEAFRARIQFSCSFPVFDNQPFLATLDHFILVDIGSHILDTARFLFGEADTLLCRTQRVNPAIRGEDVATVLLSAAHCPVVTCEMSYASRLKDERFPETFIVVEGSLGSIELRADGWIYVTTAAGTESRQVVPPHYEWQDPAYAAVQASIVDCNRALLDALRSGKAAETSGRDNLRTTALVWASYTSASQGKLINVEEFEKK